jgi:hypothetical protein
MEREKRELKRPLFEMNGHPVLDFQVFDAENSITFFVIQINRSPTPYDMDFGKLMEAAGGWEVLKQKKWMAEDGRALVQVGQERKCVVHGPGTYRLDLTYTRKEETYH